MNWLLYTDNANSPALLNLHHVERVRIVNDFDAEWSVVASTRTDSYTLSWHNTIEEAIIRLREVSNAVAALDVRRTRP